MLQSVILSAGFLLSNTSLIGGQNINGSRAEIVDVTFCDLVREPSKYDGKIVRVNAIHFVFHHDFLYDPDCNSRDYYMHSAIDCDSEESCKKFRELLERQKDCPQNQLVSLQVMG